MLSASVRQAFLPKFENEDKDTSIASSIVEEVGPRVCDPAHLRLGRMGASSPPLIPAAAPSPLQEDKRHMAALTSTLTLP